jgi:hypothetical protein
MRTSKCPRVHRVLAPEGTGIGAQLFRPTDTQSWISVLSDMLPTIQMPQQTMSDSTSNGEQVHPHLMAVTVLLWTMGVFAEVGDRRACLLAWPQLPVPGTRCARPEGKDAAFLLVFQRLLRHPGPSPQHAAVRRTRQTEPVHSAAMVSALSISGTCSLVRRASIQACSFAR